MTRNGDLVDTDDKNKTVNLVKNKQIQTGITLQGWIPLNVCSTASDDLLITMTSDDRKQTKDVRYSGSKEIQTIQFDDQGRPLYSSGGYTKCISENMNLDVYVANNKAVAKEWWSISQENSDLDTLVIPLIPRNHLLHTDIDILIIPLIPQKSRGIATDNQNHILTADHYIGCIHILDQDGQSLHYIQISDLRSPWGLYVDIKDNLFVAALFTAEVKKIQYLQPQH
ncbi:uncharacterized protein LOC125655728 isoform X2 [Ostrea edulis]|uniref:uncharacterized protein LOC125655728 isoform X2 n=1 Tax=Ostrea edulis TaxID=37623 RepID=UPI0020959164|nr:uncharacterized protein LOC125655728 isoform X2 [Ostrea edulis]XP_056000112.1 uncharacterized protein LOC125655728 isoform X2 [Ostrea edulis]